jgi:hypothetical protein
MEVFGDYYILSGYASLNMSPMMRAPELMAIGNYSLLKSQESADNFLQLVKSNTSPS